VDGFLEIVLLLDECELEGVLDTGGLVGALLDVDAGLFVFLVRFDDDGGRPGGDPTGRRFEEDEDADLSGWWVTFPSVYCLVRVL
jgi:hypothetical protein